MEGCVAPLLILLVVAAFIALAFYQGKKHRELLDRIAGRRDGVTVEASTFGGARVRYRRAGWSAEVTFQRGGKNTPPHTRFEASLARPLGRLHVKRHGFFAGLQKFFGAEDIEIGSAFFDEMFMISATPTSFAREFLTPVMRRRIETLRRINDDVVLDLHGRRLHLQVRALLRDEARLTGLLDICEAIADDAVGGLKPPETPNARGIDFVEAVEGEGGECQICGHDMTEQVVRCRKCRTRHHRPCWEYYGSCSTFGCGEKKHVRA